MSHKRFLFVAGAPRSGTSALTYALNSIDDVQVGNELFPHVIKNCDDFREELFSEENLRVAASKWMEPEAARAALQAFDSSQIIGDKHPHYHRFLAQMRSNFPNFYLIMIYRDILPVANSFQQRFFDENHDRWKLDESRAIGYWFKAAEAYLKFAEQVPSNTLLVSYEKLFDAQPEDARRYFRRIYTAMNRHLPLGPIDDTQLMEVLNESAKRKKQRAVISGEDAEMERLFGLAVAIKQKRSIEGYQKLKQLMDRASADLSAPTA